METTEFLRYEMIVFGSDKMGGSTQQHWCHWDNFLVLQTCEEALTEKYKTIMKSFKKYESSALDVAEDLLCERQESWDNNSSKDERDNSGQDFRGF
jgi:hypothetical protein